MVLLSKAGESVPALTVRLDKVASLDFRVTAVVYCLSVPSWAVTAMVIILEPTFKLALDGLPLVAGKPFTVIVAPAASESVGVTSMLVVALGTLTA
mgnify:CR=1 FL=1